MTWDVERAESADSSEEEDNNPWLAQQPEASSSRDHQCSAVEPANSVSDSRELAENPLYHGSPTLGGLSWNSSASQKARTPLSIEATRPSLYRLTSNSFNGLLQGFETLSFPNASQESISTDDTGLNGSRRSLDELRKLSIKGKGSATEAESSAFDALSEPHAKSRGREALFHPVQKGDSLTSLALLYGCTVRQHGHSRATLVNWGAQRSVITRADFNGTCRCKPYEARTSYGTMTLYTCESICTYH
jgi:hypothetical protein